MTSRGKTLLPGHALVGEGMAFTSDGARSKGNWGGSGGAGHAKCECGAVSPELPSGRARRAWHVEHKEAVMPSFGTSTSSGQSG